MRAQKQLKLILASVICIFCAIELILQHINTSSVQTAANHRASLWNYTLLPMTWPRMTEYDDQTNTNITYDMILLICTTFYGKDATRSVFKDGVRVHKCNIEDEKTGVKYVNRTILITNNRVKYQKYASGLLFHGSDFQHQHVRAYKQQASVDTNARNPVYIYFSVESPGSINRIADPQIMAKFNLLASYHSHADIGWPYIDIPTLRFLVDNQSVPFDQKNKDVPLAWFGSNCHAHNGRQLYLKELFKHVKTHSFGRCLHNTNLEQIQAKQTNMVQVISQYKFYIVIENSNCKDYITEKLGNAMKAATVPVVFSVNNTPNYDYFMPANSYINAADFSSAEQLGSYLTYVAQNETLYNSYLKYKVNSLTTKGKQREWQTIITNYPFLQKQHQWNWCLAAEQVFNYIKYNKTQALGGDFCLSADIMKDYIQAH